MQAVVSPHRRPPGAHVCLDQLCIVHQDQQCPQNSLSWHAEGKFDTCGRGECGGVGGGGGGREGGEGGGGKEEEEGEEEEKGKRRRRIGDTGSMSLLLIW